MRLETAFAGILAQFFPAARMCQCDTAAQCALEQAVWRLRELRFDLREARMEGRAVSVLRLAVEVCEQERRVREAARMLRERETPAG